MGGNRKNILGKLCAEMHATSWKKKRFSLVELSPTSSSIKTSFSNLFTPRNKRLMTYLLQPLGICSHSQESTSFYTITILELSKFQISFHEFFSLKILLIFEIEWHFIGKFTLLKASPKLRTPKRQEQRGFYVTIRNYMYATTSFLFRTIRVRVNMWQPATRNP